MANTSDMLSVLNRHKAPEPAIDPLDLDRQSVFMFFGQLAHSMRFLSFLHHMDTVDTWAFDYVQGERPDSNEVKAFLSLLQTTVNQHVGHVEQCLPPLVSLMSRLTSSRSMYLIQFIAQRNPAFIAALLTYLDQTSATSVESLSILRRFDTFLRAKLLKEIFSGERLTRIIGILRSYSHA